jgi:hypothetical protein
VADGPGSGAQGPLAGRLDVVADERDVGDAVAVPLEKLGGGRPLGDDQAHIAAFQQRRLSAGGVRACASR